RGASRTMIPPHARRLLEQVKNPGSAEIARQSWSGLLQMLPPSWTAPNAFFYPGMGGPPMISHGVILEMNSTVAAAQPTAANHPVQALAASLLAVDRAENGDAGPMKLIDLLAQDAAALPALESYVRTLDPTAVARDNQFRYYAALADAYARSGRAKEEFDRL